MKLKDLDEMLKPFNRDANLSVCGEGVPNRIIGFPSSHNLTLECDSDTEDEASKLRGELSDAEDEIGKYKNAVKEILNIAREATQETWREDMQSIEDKANDLV